MCRNTTDLYRLCIVYSAALLNSLSVLVDFYWFFWTFHIDCHVVCEQDSCTSSFQSRCLLFLFLGLFFWPKLAVQCWREVVMVDIFVLFLIIGGERKLSSFPRLLTFYCECWILSDAFSSSIVMVIWFLDFSFLICEVVLIDFKMLKQLCILRIKPTLSRYSILCMYCWIQICWRVFLEVLCLCSWEILVYSFLYL